MRHSLAIRTAAILVAVLSALMLATGTLIHRKTQAIVSTVKEAELDAQFARFRSQLDDISRSRERAALTAVRLGEWIYREKMRNPSFDVRAATENACASVLEAQPLSTIGVGLWYEPFAIERDVKWVGPYANRGADRHVAITWEYANDAYDYPHQGWYTKVVPADWNRAQRISAPVGLTEPYLDALDGKPTVFQTTAYVMHGPDGRVIGVATVDATLDSIDALLAELRITPSSSAFLIDPSGLVLFPVARTDRLSRVSSLAYARSVDVTNVREGQIKHAHGIRFHGHINDISYTRLHSHAVLGVVLATDEAYAVLDVLSKNTLAYGATTVLLIALLTLFVLQRQLRPLATVRDGAREVAAGNLDYVIPVESNDEIGHLASAFGHMVKEVKSRDASLRDHASNLERKVTDRTKAITLILDSTGDGLLRVGLDGSVEGNVSRAAIDWFGPCEGRKVWSYLFEAESTKALEFELSFEQLAEDTLPFELVADQMPRWTERNGRKLELEFRKVVDDGRFESVLVIVRDVTDKLAAESREAELREMTAVLQCFSRDRVGFALAIDECGHLLERMVSGADTVERSRDLHTLKGSSAMIGFSRFSQACHVLESMIAEDASAVGTTELLSLRGAFQETLERIEHIVGDSESDTIRIVRADFDHLLGQIERKAEHGALLALVRSLRYEPTAVALARLGQQAKLIGERLGKPLDIAIEDDGTRLPPERTQELFVTLIHVVRNAIDHGVELPEERAARGKPATSRMRLSAKMEGKTLVISIADDGRGILWERVRERARSLGMPHETRKDLEDALFSDGFSTKDEITDLSGRGIGLPAVRRATEKLGGRLEIESEAGKGTVLRFSLPT